MLEASSRLILAIAAFTAAGRLFWGAEAQLEARDGAVFDRRILYLSFFPLHVLCLALKTTLSRWAARQMAIEAQQTPPFVKTCP